MRHNVFKANGGKKRFSEYGRFQNAADADGCGVAVEHLSVVFAWDGRFDANARRSKVERDSSVTRPVMRLDLYARKRLQLVPGDRRPLADIHHTRL